MVLGNQAADGQQFVGIGAPDAGEDQELFRVEVEVVARTLLLAGGDLRKDCGHVRLVRLFVV